VPAGAAEAAIAHVRRAIAGRASNETNSSSRHVEATTAAAAAAAAAAIGGCCAGVASL